MRLPFAGAVARNLVRVEMEYLVSFNFCSRTLTMIETPLDAKLEDVLSFTRDEHYRLYRRTCWRLRLAEKCVRPSSWKVNPILFEDHQIWLILVVWFDDIQFDGQAEV